jgi:hypothetical protein
MAGIEIFDIRRMAKAMRHTEYKSLASAASEIVDNSIEAGAKIVKIIVKSETNIHTGKKEINEIGFLDNGCGMDIDLLQRCLVYGHSTRTEHKSIGKFGVGLAQASLYAAPRVEVYSWQTAKTPYNVFLDTKLMSEGKQTTILEPEPIPLPHPYSQYKNSDFSNSGTLVLWKNVDKSPVKKVQNLFERINKILAQTFRYYIAEDKVDILLIDTETYSSNQSVVAIDPMFLLENTKTLGNPNRPCSFSRGAESETIFEPLITKSIPNGYIEVPVVYDRKLVYEHGERFYRPLSENVIIKFSIVKEKFYYKALEKCPSLSKPGDTEIGKYIKNYVGVSVVRAKREIDFNRFDFFDNVNTPTNRWWSIEISFSPKLDNVFKLSSNKQHVELNRPSAVELADPKIRKNDIWCILEQVITPAIKEMKKINKNRVPVVTTPPLPIPPNGEPPLQPLPENFVLVADEDQVALRGYFDRGKIIIKYNTNFTSINDLLSNKNSREWLVQYHKGIIDFFENTSDHTLLFNFIETMNKNLDTKRK